MERRSPSAFLLESANMTFRFIVIGTLALLAVGCASRKQVSDIEGQTLLLLRYTDSLRVNSARMTESFDQLSTDFHDYTAKSAYGSSTLEEKVEGLASRLDEILNRMDRSLAPLEEYLRRQGSELDTASSSSRAVDFYDAAQKDLALGNYDLAEIGFLQFLENDPASELADDARYGLAESFYARKRYDEAIEEFDRVIDVDPVGVKAPSALLKLGLCYRAQQNNASARKAWEDLLTQFPDAEEARVARQRLDELKTPR
jgi:tol-pal system protein YbgF